jgi:hypothetical protein
MAAASVEADLLRSNVSKQSRISVTVVAKCRDSKRRNFPCDDICRPDIYSTCLVRNVGRDVCAYSYYALLFVIQKASELPQCNAMKRSQCRNVLSDVFVWMYNVYCTTKRSQGLLRNIKLLTVFINIVKYMSHDFETSFSTFRTQTKVEGISRQYTGQCLNQKEANW